MPKWLAFSSCHWLLLFIELAISATILAWISFGLINLAMANFDFVTRFGLTALREGGLVQFLLIAVKALVALVSYLVFKAAETELVFRLRNRDH